MFLRLVSVFLVLFFWSITSWAARVNIFLNITDKISRPVTLKLKNVSIVVDGKIYSLDKSPSIISSNSPFGQTFLGFKQIKNGKIEKIIFSFSCAKVAGHPALLTVKNLDVPVGYSLRSEESISLFVYWNVKGSIKGSKIHPNFYFRPQVRPLRGQNLYVSCDDASTLFVIRADTNQVEASLYVPPQPKAICVDDSLDKLFILSDRSRSLNVLELSTFRLVDNFVLPLVSSPTFLVKVSSNLMVISDPQTSYVLLFDVSSGNLLASQKVGYSPSEMFFSPSLNRIFVSSPVDQNVYFLSTDLSSIAKIKAGQRPRGLRLIGDKLYVTDFATGMVDVFQAGAWNSVGRIRSGRGAIQVFDLNDRIYISNEREGTVSVLSLGQMTVSRKVRVGQGPYSMVACPRRGWLYVALRGEDAIAVVDLTSEKLVGKISLGCRPFALVIAK